ncbi:hypothetical protein [Hyalangium rubrum]|uniref:Lipoprotein n=1 Tax=Hyalangium rubrum TaxID=3103134 RepID=A0ABU5H7Z1_9BACT|nr:hypothetical protein [Hyalangium sp. s54d21]MDY7229381.1 hypothetical protein [Hyalangium sp. s54d21]
MPTFHPHSLKRLCALILGLLLVTAAGGCDCNGGSEIIDPSDAKPSDLYGWWTHTDAQSGNVTVFGFVPQAEAARVLPIKPEEATGDVSAVYQGPRNFLSEPVQLATFEVKDGELLQTVIRDLNATPGTQQRTRIVSLEAQRTLGLQSTNSTTGSRSFSFSARCPSAQPHGSFDVAGQICNTYFSGATSLAVDAQGGVHAASSVLGRPEPPTCAPGKFAQPTYSHFASACGPGLDPLPSFRSSAMITDERTVHFAYASLSASDVSREALLFYRYRPLDLRGDWTEEQVAPQGYPVFQMRLLLKGGQPLLLVSRTNGVIELYRRDAGGWTLVPTLLANGSPLAGQMADATLDREGRLVLLLESSHQLAYERASGFELIPVPRAVMTGFGGGVTTDTSGRVHVVYTYSLIGDNASGVGGRVINGRGIYGVYDGTAWALHEMGPMAYPRIITRPEGPWRVVHAIEKAAKPALALTELAADGSLRSELLSLEPSFGQGNSPEPYYNPSAAIGADGTVAAAWDGNRVYIRPPEAQRTPARTTLTLKLEGRGRGRVRSSDGTINCTETCNVEVPIGARYQLFFEPEPGNAWEQLTCGSGYFALYGYCWLDIFPGASQQVTVKFRESPVSSLLPVGAADGSSMVKRLAARGGRVAISATTTNGKLPMGPSVVEVASAQELLGVRESDGRVWGAALPTTPEALGFRSDGSVSAMFLANREFNFPSGTVGSHTAPVLILAHYANGSFQGIERLAELPQGTSFAVDTGTVGDDDAAAAVLSNFSGFGGLGFPEYSLLVYRSPTGTVTLRGLAQTQTVTNDGQTSLAAGRAAVVLNDDFQLSFDGSNVVATRSVQDATVVTVSQTGDRTLSLWRTFQNSINLGGGPIAGQGSNSTYYAEYGQDGRYITARVLPLWQGASYLAPAPSGPIFAGPNNRGGLMVGRVTDPGYLFNYAGDLTGNKATPFLADSDLEAGSFWVAVRHQGTVDYDVATIQEPFRQLLVQLRLP